VLFMALRPTIGAFVKNFADIYEPLTKLTRKNTMFEWTDDSQTAFDKLKSAVEEATTLSFPYPNIPCIVDSDASDVAIFAVLSQVIDGVERLIAFYSRIISQTQRNYWLKSGYSPEVEELRTYYLTFRSLWAHKDDLQLIDEFLVRVIDNVVQLVVAQVIRRSLFNNVHSGPLAAHHGIERTLTQLKQAYHWPGMKKDVTSWYRHCTDCARGRGPRTSLMAG